MPSSTFSCVKREDLTALSGWAAAYKKMGSINTVRQAAREAGQYLQGQMTKMVEGESSLKDYRDFAGRFRVFSDSGNMVVGIPPTTPTLVARALKMDAIYPVADAALDLAKQAGDVEEKFYDALAGALSE